MTPSDHATVIGSLGVAILLAAFLLNLLKRLPSESAVYAGCNLVGAGLACYSSYLIGFMPFVVLECVWALVSLIGLLRALLGRNESSPAS